MSTDVDTPPLLSLEVIKQATRNVVANAMNGDFPVDPVIGADMSRTFSTINSIVKRHGLLIQKTLGDALAASGRFDVLSEVAVPITESAHDLLTSRNSVHDLQKIRLKADSKTIRMITVDLIVIDVESGWCGAYDVKRGNGSTETRKRRPIEMDLRATRLVLGSFLEKHGFMNLTKSTTAVIDYYGMSGFSDEVRLTRSQLDKHFGVPVVATIETMTAELQAALHAQLRTLLAPALKHLPKVTGDPRVTEKIVVHPAAEGPRKQLDRRDIDTVLNARPAGPGAWQSRPG